MKTRNKITIEEIWDHALEMEMPEHDDDLPSVAQIVHPPTCFCVHHWEPPDESRGLKFARVDQERPRCVIEHQAWNVGLAVSYDYWESIAWDNYPGGKDAIQSVLCNYALMAIPMPIHVYVEYGWHEGYWGSEYEFDFSWRPQTSEEVTEHACELEYLLEKVS